MSRQPIGLHAPTHLPDGSDPLDIAISALTPWFRYGFGSMGPTYGTPAFITMTSSSGGGDTDPSAHSVDAWIMAETSDGITYPDGGSLLQEGTVLGVFDFIVRDEGEAKAGGTTNGTWSVKRSSSSGAYVPVSDYKGMIGNGYILQTSTGTYVEFKLDRNGYMIVTSFPDPNPPPDSGSVKSQNRVRSSSSNTGTWPAWPFQWVEGDRISGVFQYPMDVD